MKRTLDKKNRWRSKSVAFRMSEAEAKILDDKVRASGLSKQTYLIQRALEDELIALINDMVTIMDGLKEAPDEKLLKNSHRKSTDGDGAERT